MSQQTRKSRYHRADRNQQTYTTQADARLLRTLYTLRFCATSSLLTALAAHRHPGGVTRRLRNLFDRPGLLDRINRDGMASFGGTREPIYYLGTGAAVEVDETRPSYSRLSPEEIQARINDEVRPRYVAHRDWRASILEDALGIDRKTIAAMLDRNEDVALKIVSQQGQSNIKHFLLISSIVSLFLLADDEASTTRIVDVHTDGAAKFSVPASVASAELRRFAVGTGKDAYFPMKPDAVIVLEQDGKRHAIILEAETGTQSGNKVGPKLATFLAANDADLFDDLLASASIEPVDSVRVLLVSASAQHFNLAMNCLFDVKPAGSGLFLFAHMGKGGIEFAPGTVCAESIKNNWRVEEFRTWKETGVAPSSTAKNGDDDARMLAAIRGQLSSPLFYQLRDVPGGTRRGDLASHVRRIPLLP